MNFIPIVLPFALIAPTPLPLYIPFWESIGVIAFLSLVVSPMVKRLIEAGRVEADSARSEYMLALYKRREKPWAKRMAASMNRTVYKRLRTLPPEDRIYFK